MKRFFLILASTCTWGQAPQALAHAKTEPLPNRLLEEFRHVTGSMGMAAAIVREGKLVWRGESGFAERAARAPVTANTQFRLGSVSKFVTIAMLARLVDQNKIDVNRPVRSYLPQFPLQDDRTTVMQLAAHTSGMGHYQMPGDAALDARTAPYASVTESLDIFKDRPLAHAAGSKYLYSSFGYNLLSAVMEQAAHKDYLRLLVNVQATIAAEISADSLMTHTPSAKPGASAQPENAVTPAAIRTTTSPVPSCSCRRLATARPCSARMIISAAGWHPGALTCGVSR